jgi:IS30 family transposase
MKYRQITSGERYMLAALRKQGSSAAAIARQLGRHPSTIAREIRRSQCNDGAYRPSKADRRTRGRRSRSRRNRRFRPEDFRLVESLLPHLWSPEQIAGHLKRRQLLSIRPLVGTRHQNTNGLIRQYLPKGSSMHGITQLDCSLIADALNARPETELPNAPGVLR